MKTLVTITVLAALLIGMSSIELAAQETQDLYNTKVLFHGTKQVADSSNFQLAGWTVFPNIGNGPVLMVGGIGYSVPDTWGVEVMAGTFTKEQSGQFIIDVRASYDAFDPIHLWINVEYFPKSGDWYTYLDANYRIGKLGLIGIETENMHFADKEDDLSFGPRVVLPLSQGQFVLIGAYQFHSGDNANQVWSRMVLNF